MPWLTASKRAKKSKVQRKRPIDKGKIIAMMNAGNLPTKEIAAECHCTDTYVYQIMKDFRSGKIDLQGNFVKEG